MSTATVEAPLAVEADPRISFRSHVRHTGALIRRNLLWIRQDPESMFDAILFPVIFTLLFVYVFGGSIWQSLGGGQERCGPLLEFSDQRFKRFIDVDRGGSLSMLEGRPFPPESHHFSCNGLHHAMCVPNTPFPPAAPLLTAAPLGERIAARLKQLVGGDAEEIGNRVQILELNLPRALQELVQGGRMPAHGHRDVLLIHFVNSEQRLDVFTELNSRFVCHCVL